MCVAPRRPSPPPAPEPIPVAPPIVSGNATTKKDAPKQANSASQISTGTAMSAKKRAGRGSLRIPLTSSGLTGSGLQYPTS
jgi:hypothetical protein